MFEKKEEDKVNAVIGDNNIADIPEKGSTSGTDEVMHNVNVHSMPERFLPQKSKPKIGGKQKVILTAIILVVLLVGVIGGIVYFVSKNIDKDNSNQDVVINENTNEDNENTNEDNENTNEDNENTNEDNENTNEDNENTNKDNENTNVPVVPPTAEEIDTDNDNLTDEEEIIYKTNTNRADTDRDGYEDGIEIQNLYNPLASDELLVNSGLITIYQNPTFKYSIFRPKSWVSSVEGVLDNVLFTPDSETGEYITLSVDPADNLSLIEWRDINYPTMEFENFSLSDSSALRSLSGLNVFVKHGNYIYTLTYEIPEILMPVKNFSTTFEMMLQSFTLTDVNNNDGDVTINCTKYRYSNCPDDCIKNCIPSSQECHEVDGDFVCDHSDDCEGAGSCVNPE